MDRLDMLYIMLVLLYDINVFSGMNFPVCELREGK